MTAIPLKALGKSLANATHYSLKHLHRNSLWLLAEFDVSTTELCGVLELWRLASDSPSDTEWRRAERCGLVSMASLTVTIFSDVCTVFTLPPFFFSVEPVASKFRTQVLMACSEGTARLWSIPTLFEIHAERSQNCHHFVKRFHSKSTLRSSRQLHCN